MVLTPTYQVCTFNAQGSTTAAGCAGCDILAVQSIALPLFKYPAAGVCIVKVTVLFTVVVTVGKVVGVKLFIVK